MHEVPVSASRRWCVLFVLFFSENVSAREQRWMGSTVVSLVLYEGLCIMNVCVRGLKVAQMPVCLFVVEQIARPARHGKLFELC